MQGEMQVAMKENVIRRKTIGPKADSGGDSDPRDGGVQSVDRALQIIETLAEDDEGYRLSDLAGAPACRPRPRTGCWDAGEAPLRASSIAPNRSGTSARRGFSVGRPSPVRRNFVAQAMPYLRKLRDHDPRNRQSRRRRR